MAQYTSISDYSREMEPDEKEETKIKFYLEAFLKYLVRNIDWKDLLLDYHAYTPAQREYLSRIGRQHPEEATERCLEMIFNDVHTEGKYTALLTALENAKNQKVIDILKGNLIPTNETNRNLIYTYGRTICEELTVIEILDPLCAVAVLDDKGRQEIHQKANMSGNWEAVFSLLFLLPKKNTDWYQHFISTLLKTNYESLARRIDGKLCMKLEAAGDNDLVSGDFTSCRFISSNTTTGLPYDDTSSDYRAGKLRDDIDGDGSIREHVVSDYYEPSLNNLDDPPPPTPPLPSSPLDTITSNFSSILIHEQDEEKLSNIDCNLQSTDVKTKYEKMGSLDKNIPVEQAINDDDNCDDSDNDDDDFATASSSCSDNENGDTDRLVLYPYQLELAEIAVKGLNTIVCAGTGSGKTFVAIHVIKKHFEGARGPRKVAFMAPTSALVKQQSDKCKQFLMDLKVKLVTGEDDDSKMLGLFLPHNDILCFTPQILVNNLANCSIKSISDFTMLILDECHHTKGGEPYNLLMQEYLEHKTINARKLPQVLGLTATIGIGKSHTEMEARDYILRVMACLDVTRLSQVERNKEHYLEKTIEPMEEKIPMRIPANNPCKEILLKAIDDTEDRLQDMALLQPSLVELMVEKCPPNKESQEYQKWTIDVMKTAQQSVDDFNISRNVSACAKYLNNYNAAIEVNSLLRPADIITFLAEKHKEDSEQKEKLTQVENELLKKLNQVQKDVLRYKAAENPNVRILGDTLKQMLADKGEDSRAMVFVKTRATCKSLAAFLNTDLRDIDVKTSPLYGKENRGSDDGMTEAVQNDVLEKFRQAFYKVIVATSVGVEGIDVPDCNIVLSYNYSGNEITKIQMKGRSRKHGATAITMGSEKIMEEEEINAYKASMMQSAMKLVRRLSENEVNKKVKQFQSEEVQKMRFRKQVEESKLQQKTGEDFLIQCRRCNARVAYLSDIRVIGHQHIVIDKSLENRINIRPHKSPKVYEGFKKHSKMYCKKCPMDWGIIANKDGLTCRILKIISTKFTSVETGVPRLFAKWDEVPGRVEEIKSEDLPRLLGQIAK